MISSINIVLATFGRYGCICHNVYALMFWGCGADLGCRYGIQSKCGCTHTHATNLHWRLDDIQGWTHTHT